MTPLAELSLHAEFQILINFCGGWSTASKEAESPSKGGGVSGDPNFFLQISFSLVKMSFLVKFHLPGMPGSALKVFGGGSKPLVQASDLDLDQGEQQYITSKY